jgi:hypothetical protein
MLQLRTHIISCSGLLRNQPIPVPRKKHARHLIISRDRRGFYHMPLAQHKLDCD